MKILIVYNENKPAVIEFINSIKDLKTGHDIDYVPLTGMLNQDVEHELIVTAGGDGTALRTVFHLANNVFKQGELPPFISVDFGRRGFLSTISPRDFLRLLKTRIDPGSLDRKTRRLGRFAAGDSGYYFLNEVSVLRHVNAQITNIRIRYDHTELSARADGIIVATETGSSAYAYSAGGPVVVGCDEALVCVLVAPEERIGPFVIGKEKQPLTIDVGTESAGLSLDGGAYITNHIKSFSVAISERTVSFYGQR